MTFDALVRGIALIARRDEQLLRDYSIGSVIAKDEHSTGEAQISWDWVTRTRSEQDRSRVLFQSLASVTAEETCEKVDNTPQSNDTNGQQLEDVLDVLGAIQPSRRSKEMPLLQRNFHHTAVKLRDTEPLQHRFPATIKRKELLSFVRLLIAIQSYGTYHGSPCNCTSKDDLKLSEERSKVIDIIAKKLLDDHIASSQQDISFQEFHSLVSSSPDHLFEGLAPVFNTLVHPGSFTVDEMWLHDAAVSDRDQVQSASAKFCWEENPKMSYCHRKSARG
ncbi:hypothetical protein MMC13_007072 [Lambiella insularis]|nr:hypothetical protein [Lambiella insularis]